MGLEVMAGAQVGVGWEGCCQERDGTDRTHGLTLGVMGKEAKTEQPGSVQSGSDLCLT